MNRLMQSEPIAVITTITAAVEALLLWLVVMGWWDATDDQIASTMTLVLAIGAIVQIVIGRASVTPNERVITRRK